MAIIAKDSGGSRDFEPIPAGTHIAICDMVVDLGMQDGGQYGPKHKVYLRWQVPSERVEYVKDGVEVNNPAAIGRTLGLSLSEKSHLRPLLEAWRGKPFTSEELRGFDIASVAGAPCMISVIHEPGRDGKVFANVNAVMALPKGTPRPQVEGDVIVYDGDNQGQWDLLRPWLQERINNQVSEDTSLVASQTAQANQLAYGALDDDLSDVPF